MAITATEGNGISIKDIFIEKGAAMSLKEKSGSGNPDSSQKNKGPEIPLDHRAFFNIENAIISFRNQPKS